MISSTSWDVLWSSASCCCTCTARSSWCWAVTGDGDIRRPPTLAAVARLPRSRSLALRLGIIERGETRRRGGASPREPTTLLAKPFAPPTAQPHEGHKLHDLTRDTSSHPWGTRWKAGTLQPEADI